MSDQIFVEAHEHFVKQSYRNRCCIAGPNGKQSLIIPIRHQNLDSVPVTGIQISYESNWNKIHWRSITAAYRNSPYFEFFEDDFETLYSNPPPDLFGWNMLLLKKIFEIFSIGKQIILTKEYSEKFNGTDLRNIIHPKKNSLVQLNYHQIFENRNGFINDLSIIDYLFNEGNSLEKILNND